MSGSIDQTDGNGGGFFGDNGGLMSALMNPGVQALAGFAQGAAQAAMPSRMPIPTGAALGMAAGGALQGLGNSENMQLQQQQVQQARMNNQMTASQLPLVQAKNQFMTNLWKSPQLQAGVTGGSQGASASNAGSTSGSTSGASGAASGSTGGNTTMDYTPSINNAYSSLPNDQTRQLVQNAVFQAGLAPSMVAPWISTLQNESGANINAPDGKAGEIGPGQVLPTTGQGMGYTPQQLRDPQTNLVASARYFKQQAALSGGNTSGAFAGYNTGSPTSNADPGYVQQGNQRLASWQYPGVNSDGSAPLTGGQAYSQAQQLYAQANQLEQAQNTARFYQGVGIPYQMPAGDPQAIRQQAQQLTTYALAGPTEAAKQQADVANDPTKRYIPTRTGMYDAVTGQYIHAPEATTFYDANGVGYRGFTTEKQDGTISYEGGAPGMSGQMQPTELSPGEKEAMEGEAEIYNKEDRNNFDAANGTEAQLDTMDQNIAALNAGGGGMFTTGAGANTRAEIAKTANSMASVLGVQQSDLPYDPNKVANWEDITKGSKKLATVYARSLGSHEAASVVNMVSSATPSAENTAQGYYAVSGSMHEADNLTIDKYNFKTQWLQDHEGNLIGADAAFNKQFPPSMYADRALSLMNPVKITSQSQLSNYLPGTQIILPNGVRTMVPIRDGMTIPSYIAKLTGQGQQPDGNASQSGGGMPAQTGAAPATVLPPVTVNYQAAQGGK